MTEHSPEDLQDVQDHLQAIVAALARSHEGQQPSDVEDELRRRLTDAGIPEQPGPWMRDTSVEIAAGRITLVSPDAEAQAVTAEPDPDQHAAG